MVSLQKGGMPPSHYMLQPRLRDAGIAVVLTSRLLTLALVLLRSGTVFTVVHTMLR